MLAFIYRNVTLHFKNKCTEIMMRELKKRGGGEMSFMSRNSFQQSNLA